VLNPSCIVQVVVLVCAVNFTTDVFFLLKFSNKTIFSPQERPCLDWEDLLPVSGYFRCQRQAEEQEQPQARTLQGPGQHQAQVEAHASPPQVERSGLAGINQV